jgi:Minor capsid protein
MSITVRVRIDRNRIRGRFRNGINAAQIVLDNQVLKDSNYYIPYREGYLERSGVRRTNPGNGKVIWDMPYARRLYYNPQFNFSKTAHPNAQGLWFEAAKAKKRAAWIRAAKEALKRSF